MPHQPAWHILDNNFAEQNDGLSPPTRRLTELELVDSPVCPTDLTCNNFNTLRLSPFILRIVNLDRNDPPGYVSDAVPRQDGFNSNSGADFRISAAPRMPVIRVKCHVEGFDPSDFPIYWRLQCRHVLCRHQPQGNYQYRGACEILEDEWQGKSAVTDFKLFEPVSRTTLTYDYNSNDPDGPVMGGNAILSVAAMPRGATVVLMDYVHLRIGGTNPGQSDVVGHVNIVLSSRDPNLPHMVNAIFTHENAFQQFKNTVQHYTHMHFQKKHHHNDPTQPDCNVLFDWPDDPDHFPSVSFDWGVGISQYTKTLGITVGRETAWDWRANVRRGINEFLGKLRSHYKAQSTWQQWAHRSWKAYNGSGPQAEAYANTLAGLPEGQQVSNDQVPADVDVDALTAEIPGPQEKPVPPYWPSLFAPGDYPSTTSETTGVRA